MTPPPPAALELRDISRRFGSTVALDRARLTLRKGTVHSLLGENGAGKTTLMRVAFGLLRPDAGEIVLDEQPRAWRSSAEAIAAGVGMVHQHFSLVGAMTVTENVALGASGLLTRFDRSATSALIRRTAEDAGLVVPPDSLAADLPVSAQQRVEIVKALVRNAGILILDEPTAVLTPAEGHELFAWLRRFVTTGASVVLITHKVREALAVSDDVTVLRRGQTVLSGSTAELAEARVVEAMLGTPGEEFAAAASSARGVGAVSLRLRSVTAAIAGDRSQLRGVSVEVRRGEIVGVAGVEGAGQHALLRVLAGRLRPTSGEVDLPPLVGFVPEDRLRDAIIPELSVVENFALLDAGTRTGRMRWSAIAEHVTQAMRDYDVRGEGAQATVGSLSGGNQQKLVFARELDAHPDALVVENPTRGLDVRASAEVLARLRAARDRGAAVVVYSSDLDELVGLSNRALVCFGGEVREVPVDAAVMGRAMVGAA